MRIPIKLVQLLASARSGLAYHLVRLQTRSIPGESPPAYAVPIGCTLDQLLRLMGELREAHRADSERLDFYWQAPHQLSARWWIGHATPDELRVSKALHSIACGELTTAQLLRWVKRDRYWLATREDGPATDWPEAAWLEHFGARFGLDRDEIDAWLLEQHRLCDGWFYVERPLAS